MSNNEVKKVALMHTTGQVLNTNITSECSDTPSTQTPALSRDKEEKHELVKIRNVQITSILPSM